MLHPRSALLALLPRFEHRAVPIVLMALTIDVVGFGVVMPVLPGLVGRLAQVDLPQATRIAGWMLAAFAIAQFFAAPIMGGLGDRFGRRPVLIAAMLAFALDYALMAVASSIGWLFAGRVVAGVAGATFGPIGAVIADVTPAKRRAIGYGYIGAAAGLGLIIGPAVGGLVASFGERAPFWFAAGLAASNAMLMAGLLPETLLRDHRRPFRFSDANVVGSFRPLFSASGGASALLSAWFLWQLGGVVYPATWSFWASIRFGWGAMQIGWSLAWIGFLQLLVQMLLTERLMKKVGEYGIAIIGLGAGGLTMIAYAFATRGWEVYAFFVVGCLGALAWPALNGMLSRMVDATRQGALQGGIGSMNSVAAVIGPLLATQALAWGAPKGFAGAAFAVAGLLILGSMAIIAGARPHQNRA